MGGSYKHLINVFGIRRSSYDFTKGVGIFAAGCTGEVVKEVEILREGRNRR